MGVREKIGRLLLPGAMTTAEVTAMVESKVNEAVVQARQAMPVNLNYDPKGEGYRKTGGQDAIRELLVTAQDTMLEMAYYLYDTSGMAKRFVRDTRNFCLGEGVTFSVQNDDEAGSAKGILSEFWADPRNRMDLRLSKRVEFLGLLGEACYPVSVDKRTGRVWMSYIDPAMIDQVLLVPGFPEMPAAVKIKGKGGRTGETLTAVNAETDIRRPSYGRLVGDVFYFAVNNPPNGPRGRSDLLHLFDLMEGYEEGLFEELDRGRQQKAFIWDVLVKGADTEGIKEFLANTPQPRTGSVNAHNEQVEWNAVTPDIKAGDGRQLFDMIKSYMAATMNRPDSWFGGGGKAYSNEADLMGEPTYKDLADRQLYVKYMLEMILQFVLDQAILAGRLRDRQDAPLRACVQMPEMSSKDTKKIIDSLFSLAQGLTLAEGNKWISQEKAAEIFASVASQVGVDIDAAEEIKKMAGSLVTDDYARREDLVNAVTERLKAQNAPGS